MNHDFTSLHDASLFYADSGATVRAKQVLAEEANKVFGATIAEREHRYVNACRRLGDFIDADISGREVMDTLNTAGELNGMTQQERSDAIARAIEESNRRDRAQPKKMNNAPQVAIPPDDTADDEDAFPSFLPPPPPVPVGVFPDLIQSIIQDAASAFSVPLEVPVCAMLSLSSATIGRARGLMIKGNWKPCANMYLCLVGKSGSGKSPCTNAMLDAINDVEAEYYKEWLDANADYENETLRYKETLKAYTKGKIDDPGPAPERPKLKQVFVEDVTTEALRTVLRDNPRGAMWYRDEISGLLLDLDKYSGEKGSTKNRLMTLYDCGAWKTNRADNGKDTYIRNACLSIFGGIQPKKLAEAFCKSDAESGFLPRFMFIRFVQTGPQLFSEADFKHLPDLTEIARSFLSLKLSENGSTQYIGVSKEAKQIYVQWHDRIATESWMGSADDEDSVLSKLRDQCLRLCLIIHLLEAVAGQHDDFSLVSLDTMKKAIVLADWFREHQQQAWSLIGHGRKKAVEAEPLERRVALAILDLQAEIQNGQLPVSRVVEQVNIGSNIAIDGRVIGRSWKKLGISKSRDPKKRSIVVGRNTICRLMTITTG